MDKKTCMMFFGKNVSIERIVIIQENGIVSEKVWLIKGHVERVINTDLIIKFNGTLQAYSLNSIKSIREVI